MRDNTLALVDAFLSQTPPQSLVGSSCTLHTNQGLKPAKITSGTPYSYTITTIDGKQSLNVPKSVAKQLFPSFNQNKA